MRTVTKSTLIRIRTGGAQVLLLSMTFFFTTPVMQANADEPSSPQEKVETQPNLIAIQQNLIDDMRRRLQRLEQRGQHSEDHGVPTSPETAEDIRPQFGVNLGVLGDINYSTKNREGEHNAFSLGGLDLYSTAGYGTRLNFLAELVLELEEDGETSLDLERLWAGYTFSDLLILRAGRQHSALGYWNKTYHHGKQLFLTIDRPFFLVFEDDGGILPVHIVGIELEGAKSLGGLRWKYEMDLGNGPRINFTEHILDPNNRSDTNNSKQIVLRLSARPVRYPGLTLGLFGTTYELDTTTKTGLEEAILGADLSYLNAGLEFISEYFRLRNSQDHADAFYIQLGYTLFEILTPYARYEYLNLDPTDPYFLDLQNNADRYQQILGLRYEIDYLRSSLKLQYRRDDKKGAKTFNTMEAQWSFSF